MIYTTQGLLKQCSQVQIFLKEKKLITAEVKLHGWFYTKPVFTVLVEYI